MAQGHNRHNDFSHAQAAMSVPGIRLASGSMSFAAAQMKSWLRKHVVAILVVTNRPRRELK